MHRSLDVGEFYELNRRQFDRFLQWKGLSDPGDRSDVVQTYLLDIIERGTLGRADSCCNTEAAYSSYMTRSLQNHMAGWLRTEKHWLGTPGDFANYNCYADSSVIPFSNLAIEEFRNWARDPHVDSAIEDILTDKSGGTHSTAYRYFQQFRNLYRDFIKSFAL